MPEHRAPDEHDDDLTALHDADPVDPADVPSPTQPEAVALFDRITMADTTPAPHEEARRLPRRRTTLAISAGLVAVIAAAGAAWALTRDDDTVLSDPPSAFTTEPDTSATSAPVTPGGSSSASCVEIYDPTTLADRETAFDGTVTSVGGDDITFAVNRWYTADAGDEITLRGASTLAGSTSVGDALDLAPGTRLLVAGDGGFAWSCGFTQPYDAAIAERWAEAFAG